ncbi:unnamed protein product [Urochloa humidicola]
MAAAALTQQQQQQQEYEEVAKTTATVHMVDAWDYKGRPAVRSSSGGWLSAAMILVVELNERLTTLGVAVNLVPYLTGTMHLGSAASANAVTNFLGASFMLCLLGGFVADTYLGRYLTIAISTAVQAAGMAVLTVSTAAPDLRPPPCHQNNPQDDVSTCVAASGTQVGVLYLGLYLTALGTGGLKSSVSGFGSDQFDESDPGERRRMARFFSWFFFFISIGSLLAVTVLVYVQDSGRLGRPWGYGACVAAIAAGLLVFLAGTARYRFKKLVGSPLTQIAAVTMAAWRNRAMPLPPDPADLYDIDHAKANGEDVKGKQKLPHTKQCRFLERAAIVESSPACMLTDVEEVKQVVRMLPVWATTIPFWTIYAQMTTFSVAQADAMDRRPFGSSSFQIPAGSLTVFLVASILVSVPVYDRLVAPLARRRTANPHGLSPLQRISVGLLLSALAMVTAALAERRRRDTSLAGATPSSAFLLVPQFFLVGAGEAFTYVGQLDFFLRECPRGMKTMSTGLFLSTLALGCFLSTAIVAAVQAATTWLTDDLDRGRLDSFYWLLAAIAAANLLAFVAVARGYVYKQDKYHGVDDDDAVVVHA